ncbi:hypothetical protein M422DRAFT_274860 [Sphaerobolus stellatus SS14]|uniref:Uncharacterized protein n=1 Tax=Sphaerobolus stellatus (strain SS14) TaxID=990650 RepID=A0A0C9UGQ9_SPHS4|nr:hypothetical protein M422DRAFT_274860 [Sphaerobolus stellatus SS14]
MAMKPSVINVDTLGTSTFDSARWIGTGQTYPENPSTETLAEKQRLLKIPSEYRSLLPNPSYSVKQFAEFKLPELDSKSLIIRSVEDVFYSQKPTRSINWLLTRSVPLEIVLSALSKAVGQVWFHGCHSFIGFRYKGEVKI